MPTVSPAPSSLPLAPSMPGPGSGPAAEAGGNFSDAFEAARQAQSTPSSQGALPAQGAGGTPSVAARTPTPQAPAPRTTAGGARAPENAASPDGRPETDDVAAPPDDEAAAESLLPWLPWAMPGGSAEPTADGRMWVDVALQSSGAESGASAAIAIDPRLAGAAAGRGIDDAAATGREVALTDAAERSALKAGAAQADGGATSGDPGQSQGQAESRADAAAGLPAFGRALAAADATASPGTAPTAGAPAPAALPGLAGTPTGATDAAARQVAPHVQSPAFGSALGAQLNLMVRDGVTEARLHLNPAEMGPISVQIRVVGQQARVEMVAEQAATRQALEQAMPALAGALRDSGLTLSGGGVFEQRDPRQGAPDDSGRRPGRDGQAAGDARGLADDGLIGARGRPAATPRGMVDLYA